MKRGLISWDKVVLPEREFAKRLDAVQDLITCHELDALVVYTDVWRSNDVRYVSNYMPYWNRALTVVPKGKKPILLCALSPRVYPWIKTVTVHEEIIASPNLVAQLAALAAEHNWCSIGVVDLDGLPEDLHLQVQGCGLTIIDIQRAELRPAPTEVETALHAQSAHIAREVLESQLNDPLTGLTDHQLTGRLERALRRAGAEDVVILIAHGQGAPAPASGIIVGPSTSLIVALEYNGHWSKISRNLAGIASIMPPPPGSAVHREILSGPYAWEIAPQGDSAPDAVISMQVEVEHGGARLFYGDTFLQLQGTLRVL